MKNAAHHFILAVLFLGGCISACKKKDNSTPVTPSTFNTSVPDNSPGYISYTYNNMSVGDSTEITFSSNPIFNPSLLNQALANIAQNGDYYAFQWGEVNANNANVKEIIIGTSNNSGEALGLILATSQSFAKGTYAITNNYSQGSTVIATALFQQNESRAYITGSVSGSLVVSNLDNTNNRISGTFNFTETRVDTNGLLPTITYNITNGVYHNLPFQKL